MQEEINHSENKIHRRYTPKEERLDHVKKWQESGLSVTEYCRQQNIPLTSFLGWRRAAFRPKQTFKQIVTTPPLPLARIKESEKADKVIEIIGEPAVKIRLINVSDALLIANIAKALNKCS